MSRTVVYSDPDAMIAWAQERTPGGGFRDDARAIGLESGGVFIAVTVFDTFAPRDCVMSVAADTERAWLNQEYMRHVAAFPFIRCGFPRISTIVSELNTKAIRFNEHMGLKLEGRKRKAGLDGEDWLLYGLLREECRWLPKTLQMPQKKAPAR